LKHGRDCALFLSRERNRGNNKGAKMKKWIFLILAVLLICGGVFGYIWWRTEREKELAIAKEHEKAYLKAKEKNKKTREVLDKMYQSEQRLKKENPELYKLATQPAKDK
jgi:predicted negative regulator of RcsB-dependent stress response